jgi:PAS domain S-box-containing protein
MDVSALTRITSVDTSLAEVVRASRDGIALVDGERIAWVNAALVSMLGIPANELEGALLGDLTLLVAAPLEHRVQLAALHPASGSVTGTLVRRGGAAIAVSVEASSLGIGADGRFALTFRRITPLLRALERAQAAEDRFEAMATHAPNGVFSSGHGLRLDFVNDRFAALFGRPPQDLLDLGWLDGVVREDREAVHAAIERTIDGAEVAFQFRAAHTSGVVHHLRAEAVPVVRPDRSVGFIGSLWLAEGPSLDPRPRSGAMTLSLLHRAERIAHGLAGALDGGSLPVAYQPVRSLHDDRIVTVEALLRFQHPHLGPIPALEAVRVAEASGQIVALGRDVLSTACRDLGRWRDAGGATPDYVAVNLSALQLDDPDLVDHVVAELKSNWLVGADLCLELTETELMRDPDRGAAVLAELHRIGVRIAIDDFGTGHSSLERLGQFPVELLKLDRTFVTHAGTDPTRAVVARAITDLARSLGLEVVAEGIETPDQLRWAKQLGCDHGQGYALGRPTPSTNLALEAR